ncbi:sterol desaturase family protein [Mycolicibacterium palauense]|uniref:sterol desaturase family protein n=1 Tax=Mycolicibacterium palauense TaxID=2034511 RepID=UPI000BFEB1AE|nr:sterol desaturase family protein [Mycolicibacterium palauense]
MAGFGAIVSEMLDALPPQMRDPVLFAVPFFLLLLIIEWSAARRLEHVLAGSQGPAAPGAAGDRPASGAYHRRDAFTSISMGLVSIATMGAWKFLALLGYAAIYAYLAPWQLSPQRWYTWVIALVGVDLLFYLYHRMAHRVRLVWATHQAHHSSEYFNFATALRQKWNNSGEILMWIPLPLLGVPPWMVFLSFSISLIYQFWIHTERIGTLWAPFEFVFNTPSHHRVHHGMDAAYLDKNYGGILILWDRLFGTFEPERARPHYGLTKPVGTFNIWKLQTHEYVAIARDVRAAHRLRDRLGYVFGPPGWAPPRRTQPDAAGAATAGAG